MALLRRVLLLAIGAAAAACGGDRENGGGGGTGDGGRDADGGDAGASHPFEEFPWLGTAPDVLTDRLCDEAADPDGAPDKTFIHCRIEGDDLASGDPPPKDELLVMAYNFERGQELDAQLAAFRDDPALPVPDVILASEVDRGCTRSGDRNVTREIAAALGMRYVFAVEFVELPRPGGAGGVIENVCEHGNAILSRYRLGNVGQLRYAENLSWYVPPEERAGKEGEPRLGGRIAIHADVAVGSRFVHVYTLHFESEIQALDVQVAQAVEAAEHGLRQTVPVVQGGDTNSPTYWLDLRSGGEIADRTVRAYLDRGYLDTHSGLPYEERGTRGGLVLDLIFVRAAGSSSPGRCPADACGSLSDHLPVWATIEL